MALVLKALWLWCPRQPCDQQRFCSDAEFRRKLSALLPQQSLYAALPKRPPCHRSFTLL